MASSGTAPALCRSHKIKSLDSFNLASLTITVRDVVMPYTLEFSDLADEITKRRREAIVGNTKREVD